MKSFKASPQEMLPNCRLIKGQPPPEGWFGKSWACWQGAELARGDLLLFTDADTIHAPELLRQTVSGLREDAADVYTVIGRQIMGSFWERVLQPQFFMLLAARYPRAGTTKKPHQWKQAIANGQYLLFTREVYEASGGHRSVAGEVVEDLRFAQLLVRGGWKLVMRGTDGLQTRMYRSFRGLVEGWSKNIATAALQTTAPWLLPVILPLSFVVGVILWLLPPTVLIWSLIAGGPESALVWGGFTTGLSVFIWSSASILMYLESTLWPSLSLRCSAGVVHLREELVEGHTNPLEGSGLPHAPEGQDGSTDESRLLRAGPRGLISRFLGPIPSWPVPRPGATVMNGYPAYRVRPDPTRRGPHRDHASQRLHPEGVGCGAGPSWPEVGCPAPHLDCTRCPESHHDPQGSVWFRTCPGGRRTQPSRAGKPRFE